MVHDGPRWSHMFLDSQVLVFKGKTALISVDNPEFGSENTAKCLFANKT